MTHDLDDLADIRVPVGAGNDLQIAPGLDRGKPLVSTGRDHGLAQHALGAFLALDDRHRHDDIEGPIVVARLPVQ